MKANVYHVTHYVFHAASIALTVKPADIIIVDIFKMDQVVCALQGTFLIQQQKRVKSATHCVLHVQLIAQIAKDAQANPESFK